MITTIDNFKAIVEKATITKGKMHKALDIPNDKEIKDIYTNGKKLAEDLVKKVGKKEAEKMITFAANINKESDIYDTALKSLKNINENMKKFNDYLKLVKENVQSDITDVLFLMDQDDDVPTVFAYFPNEQYNTEPNMNTSYAHIGQHSACSKIYADDCPEATPEQYKDLEQELIQQGYHLNVLNAKNEFTFNEAVVTLPELNNTYSVYDMANNGKILFAFGKLIAENEITYTFNVKDNIIDLPKDGNYMFIKKIVAVQESSNKSDNWLDWFNNKILTNQKELKNDFIEIENAMENLVLEQENKKTYNTDILYIKEKINEIKEFLNIK